MKCHIPGLHSRQLDGDRPLEGCYWSASNGPPTAGILRSLSSRSDLPSLSRSHLLADHSQVGSIAPNEPSGN